MKALVIKEVGKAEVTEVPVPALRPDYVRVKTKAIALNPTDWKHIHHKKAPIGAIVGCDYVGVVEAIGDDVKTEVKLGDTVAGIVCGSDESTPENGAFAEYLNAKDGIFVNVANKLSDKEAASLGIALITIGQGLYRSLKLPLPTEPAVEPFDLLIYGGSTAMGTMAVQCAKLSGARVITTASPRNFDLVKGYGADVVFDHTDPEVGSKIREFTENKLRLAFDTYSGPGLQICADALSSDSSLGLHYSTLLPGDEDKFPRKDVEARMTFGYFVRGEPFVKFGKEFPIVPGEYEFATKFLKITEAFLNEGKLRTHPIEVREGGLSAVLQGLDDMKNEKVSGKKLVYVL